MEGFMNFLPLVQVLGVLLASFYGISNVIRGVRGLHVAAINMFWFALGVAMISTKWLA
jgi:hypothetical protein